jgi:hypothetical protein
MEKISHTKVAAVLSTVPSMLRGLARERDDLMEKNATLQAKVSEFERRERIEKVAKVAEEKHLDSLGDTHEEKVASIETALEKGRDLNVIEEAVKMSSPRGDLGALGDDLAPGNGENQLEAYLLGHLG